LIRYGHNPIVIVLDNHGYGTERYRHAGQWEYNEIQPWDNGKLLSASAPTVSSPARPGDEIRQSLELTALVCLVALFAVGRLL
jgi:indolepyruvate decarboxylase